MKTPFSKTVYHALELAVCALVVIVVAYVLTLTGIASTEDVKAVVVGSVGLILSAIVPKYARASGIIDDHVNE